MGHPGVEHDTPDEQGGCQRRRVLRELQRVSTSFSMGPELGCSHPLQKDSRSHGDLNWRWKSGGVVVVMLLRSDEGVYYVACRLSLGVKKLGLYVVSLAAGGTSS